MANLRGGVQGGRGPATRIASESIMAWVNTWAAQLEVILDREGNYIVRLKPFQSRRIRNAGAVHERVLAAGNAHRDLVPTALYSPVDEDEVINLIE